MGLLNPWISSEEEFAQAQIATSLRPVLHRDFWAKLASGGIDVTDAARAFAAALVRAVTRRRREDRTFSNAAWREEVESTIEDWIERSLRGRGSTPTLHPDAPVAGELRSPGTLTQ
jgi:hypothetical protein